MGYKCPVCSQDFGKDKEKWEDHCKNYHLGLAESMIDVLTITTNEVGTEEYQKSLKRIESKNKVNQ